MQTGSSGTLIGTFKNINYSSIVLFSKTFHLQEKKLEEPKEAESVY
jgi:hypothetical protein